MQALSMLREHSMRVCVRAVLCVAVWPCVALFEIFEVEPKQQPASQPSLGTSDVILVTREFFQTAALGI